MFVLNDKADYLHEDATSSDFSNGNGNKMKGAMNLDLETFKKSTFLGQVGLKTGTPP